MRARLKGQSLEERNQKSLLIKEKLFALDAFRRARAVCFFVGMDEEVNTLPMIEKTMAMGKRVLVPQVNLENKELRLFEVRDLRRDLRPGVLGILEPDPASAVPAKAEDADCVVVPGLAFDKMKRRLGRGAGFYDRFLSGLDKRAFKVGLAFSFQVFPEIPHEEHDHDLDEVLTEK
jgi:5-formyltetrahydrofolate cyclo-ligase